MKYTIIRDTKEKINHGWYFDASDRCAGTIRRKLPTGDYTIDGFENILCIERKGGVAEFASNVVQKRFYAELERMKLFKFAFILLEFDLVDLLLYPIGCMPPGKARQCRYGGRFVLKKVSQFMIDYPNIHIVFCGKSGKEVASSIFNNLWEEYEKKKKS